MARVVASGGAALAQKLVDIYLTLFRLILEGHLGNAAAASRAREQKAASSRAKGRWRQPVPARSKPQKPAPMPKLQPEVSLTCSPAPLVYIQGACSA